MELADSHIHLTDFPDPENLVLQAESMTMLLLSVSTNVENARSARSLRDKHPERVRFFAGIHPSDVKTGEEPAGLEELWRDADGIGEIGLDPKYSSTDEGTPQARAFVRQLELAERLSKPVQVHSRGAQSLCLDRLSMFKLSSVLMHWFDDEERLSEVSSRGYYVSFGPALLYSRKLQRMAREATLGQILVESDGPVLYGALGQDVRGSFLIPSVIFALGEIRGVDGSEIAADVMKNTLRFLAGK